MYPIVTEEVLEMNEFLVSCFAQPLSNWQSRYLSLCTNPTMLVDWLPQLISVYAFQHLFDKCKRHNAGKVVGYSLAPSSICLLSSIGTIDTNTLDQQHKQRKFQSGFKDIS